MTWLRCQTMTLLIKNAMIIRKKRGFVMENQYEFNISIAMATYNGEKYLLGLLNK